MEELTTAWRMLKSHVEDLAREREHYLDFFERADSAYLVTDARGRIAEANGAAVDLLDRRRKYLKGKPLLALVCADERREFRRRLQGLSQPLQWRSAFAARGQRIAVELRARPMAASGSVVWSLRACA